MGISLVGQNVSIQIKGPTKSKYSRHEIAQYIYLGKFLKKRYGKNWLLWFTPSGWVEL